MDKRFNICIITQFIDNFFYGMIIKSIQEYISKIGGNVFIFNTFMLYNSPESRSFISSYLTLSQNHIDGYIILPLGASDDHIRLLSRYEKPIVLINNVLDHSSNLTVKDDGFKGTSDIVEHLIQQGHRKIAFIGWFKLFDMVERFEGYKNALERNGIEFVSEYVYKTEDAIENEGKEAAKRILEFTPEVTAVVGANDLLAYGAMEAFQAVGLNVPFDIAVCGYDNSNISRECEPHMTTVEQNIPLLGETAAIALTQKILGEKFSDDDIINISPKLIVRKSSVYSGETNNTSPFTLLDKSTSIQIFRYLENAIFNSYTISSSLKSVNFQNISEILPKIPLVFIRACYGEWIYENSLPKCLLLKKTYKFYTEEKIIGNEYFLEDFPPKQLMFESYQLKGDEVVFIMPVRSGNYDMGVFSYIAPINKFSEFVNVNFSCLNYECISFVMDRELFAEEIKKKNNEKISAINTMVAGIAHELNTPTGIGISAATLINEKANKLMEAFESGSLKRQDFINLVNDIRKSSNVIYESMNRSADLVKTFKLLSFSEPQELKKFNVKQNTEYIINLLRPKLKHIHQNIHIICDDDLEVLSYPNVITQIITNLFINSIVHGFENESEGSIVIEYRMRQSQLIISFEDNGRGMDKEVIKKIFDAFFTTKRAEGTGLGLNIVYNLVKEYLKGTIKCESQIGRGTKFTIEFPV